MSLILKIERGKALTDNLYFAVYLCRKQKPANVSFNKQEDIPAARLSLELFNIVNAKKAVIVTIQPWEVASGYRPRKDNWTYSYLLRLYKLNF